MWEGYLQHTSDLGNEQSVRIPFSAVSLYYVRTWSERVVENDTDKIEVSLYYVKHLKIKV